MKKLFSITLLMVIILSLFAPAVYAAESDLQKVLKEVNKTNNQINEMIYEAKEEAEEEIVKYKKDLEILEKEISHLKEKLDSQDINKKDSQKKYDKISEKINKKDREIQKLNDRLDKKIDKIISHLIDDTNKKATQMKEKAAKKGFEVICELVEVEIGGQIVWIDPLRVCGD